MAILIYAMIYAGSAIMVYNIARYYGFMRKMRAMGDWDKMRVPVAVPFALLVSFLAGYLTVALVGAPDFVIAGILFGGSLFVLIVLGIIYLIIDRLLESNARSNALYEQTKRGLDSLTKDCLSVFRVNLTKDVVEGREGANLHPSDLAAQSYTELLKARMEHIIVRSEADAGTGAFTREGLMNRFEAGETSAEETLFCHLANGQVAFVNLKATLVAQPDTGDVLAFITESQCNEEVVNDVLLNKALIGQYDMIAYLVDGRYGVVIGEDSKRKRGSIFPTQRNGSYWDYLAEQVAPVVHGSALETIQAVSSLGLNRVERELALHEPYESNITCLIDGELFYKRFVFYVVDAKARFYLLLKSDTTELIRKEAEHARQLEEALEEARAASQAKTTFLANMSHDIRTPMNAIVGYTDIARKSDDVGEVHDYLDKIDASSTYLLALITDVLEMSRIESGNLDLELQPVDLAAQVLQVRDMFADQMASKGIAFDVDTTQAGDARVLCDKARFERILLNLVSNAFKYTPEGGAVRMTLAQLDGPDAERASFELKVADTGIGMSAEFAEKVFDAFERERTTTASGIQGTGLGMAITKRIVDAMGGSIALRTEAGEGTEFSVTLSFERQGGASAATGGRGTDTPEAPREQAPEAPEAPGLGEVDFTGMRVLIAEDNEINLEIATIVFEELGFQVETAENGQEALDLLTSSQPGHFDAVVTDIQMPVMNGYDEARAIRALDDERLARIPIVAISANAFAEDIKAGLEAGMDSYLAKPIDVAMVVQTMTSVLHVRSDRR